jgi:methylated-DNA-[protein]-cysteine S-methyltransferase
MKHNQSIFYSASKISNLYVTVISTPRGIRKIILNEKEFISAEGAVKLYSDDPFMFGVFDQLSEYFSNTREKFNIPFDIEGTEFQKQVWKEIIKIPFGKTTTYKEIALRTSGISAVRAVGKATGANPLLIVIPCHRVINVSGKLCGYSAGLSIKEKLLEHEGILSMELFNEVRIRRTESIEE